MNIDIKEHPKMFTLRRYRSRMKQQEILLWNCRLFIRSLLHEGETKAYVEILSMTSSSCHCTYPTQKNKKENVQENHVVQF